MEKDLGHNYIWNMDMEIKFEKYYDKSKTKDLKGVIHCDNLEVEIWMF